MLNYNNTEDLDRKEAPIFFQKYRRNNFTQISNKAIEDEDSYRLHIFPICL